MQQMKTRRQFLKTGGAASTVGLAGCSNLLEDDTSNPRNPGNNEPGSDPVNPELNLLQDQEISIEWSPELADYDEVPGEHHIPVEVAGAENIDDLQLGLEKIVEAEADYEQDELLTSQIPLEQNEMQVPASEFFTGAQTLQLQQDGDTVDSAPVVKNIPEGYRVDVWNTDGEVLSEWSTPYQFDTLIHRPEEMSQKRVEHNRDTYLMENFLEEVRNDADFNEWKEKYPGWKEGERGHFDLEAWKETENINEMMKWMNPALQEKQFHTLSSAISTNAEYMAASAELAVNEIHPELEIHGWGLNNAGAHGTMMFYDVVNEEWWHSDTTAKDIERYARKPENAQLHRGGVWSPFTAKDHPEQPGFHPGPVKDELVDHEAFYDRSDKQDLYQVKSGNSKSALIGMTYIVETDPNRVFITDKWMDKAYEHIRNNGDLETIHEPLQQLVQMQRETGGRQENGGITGLYGTLNNPKIVAGELEPLQDLYNTVKKDPDILVDEDHVHQYLEDLGSTDHRLEEA